MAPRGASVLGQQQKQQVMCGKPESPKGSLISILGTGSIMVPFGSYCTTWSKCLSLKLREAAASDGLVWKAIIVLT